MKMTSIDISTNAFIDGAQEILGKNFGGNILFDGGSGRETGGYDEKASISARLKRSNLSVPRINSPDLFECKIKKREAGVIYAEVINSIEYLYSIWRRKFSRFDVGENEIFFIINLIRDHGFIKSGWHIRMISDSLDKSAPFSCLHFISFAMHRKGILADQAVYNTLSSRGFFQKFKMDSPRFGVSKYTPDYYSSYIKDSSSFAESMKKADLVINRYCMINSSILDALSIAVRGDRDILSIFDKYSDEIRYNSELLTKEFFSNIGWHISKLSTIRTIFKIHRKPEISEKIVKDLAIFEKSSKEYEEVVEFMSRIHISIYEKELAAWVLASPSFVESLKRVRLAFRNNPTGYQLYASSLGDWITTLDDFAVLKKFDEELKA